MKFKGGKSILVNGEWVYRERIYTDFYCSIIEWNNLGVGKLRFIDQLRSKLVRDGLFNGEEPHLAYNGEMTPNNEKYYKYYNRWYDTQGNYKKLWDGTQLYKLSLYREGRDEDIYFDNYSAAIIKEAIKLVTHREIKVDFYAHEGLIDHVELSFPGMCMPNIMVLIDSYSESSTHKTIVACLDAIYYALKNKTYHSYEKSLSKYYNDKYDMIYSKYIDGDSRVYNKYDYCLNWSEMFKKKICRHYNGCTIEYLNIKNSL